MSFLTKTVLGAAIDHVVDKSKGGEGYASSYQRHQKEDTKEKVFLNGKPDTRTPLQECLSRWSL